MNLRVQFTRIVLLSLLTLSVGLAAAEPAVHLLYRSEDRGRSWTRSDSGLPGDSRINALSAIADTVVAGTDSGIFISADSGKTWRKSSITGPNSARVISLAAANNHLFAGIEGAILTSTDGGRSWLTNQTFPRRIVRSLLALDGALYVGTDGAGVYQTTDFSSSSNRWIQLSAGLPPDAQVLALTSIDGQIFAGLYANGLYTWKHPAQKWIQVGAAAGIKPLTLTSTSKTLLAGHNPGGIYTSDDLGVTWSRWKGQAHRDNSDNSVPSLPSFDLAFGPTTVSLDAPIWDLAADHETAFAGAADGIFYSEDRGRHWTRATRGLPAVTPGVAFLVSSNLVLAATLTNYKSRSTIRPSWFGQ